jgi:hypothetical protein
VCADFGGTIVGFGATSAVVVCRGATSPQALPAGPVPRSRAARSSGSLIDAWAGPCPPRVAARSGRSFKAKADPGTDRVAVGVRSRSACDKHIRT